MTRSYEIRWSEVTALFGGRFDPPHLGHRQAVRELFHLPGIRNVLVVPSATPPHKPTIADTPHRIEMAKLNFSPTLIDAYPQEVSLNLSEVTRFNLNPARPSYSFDTILELRAHFSNLAFVLGTDQFTKIETWYRFPEILRQCHWIVLERRGESPSESSPSSIFSTLASSGLVVPSSSPSRWRIPSRSASSQDTFLEIVPTQAPPISSTHIREKIARLEEIPDGLLLPEVLAYLKKHSLYGIKGLHDSTKYID